MKTVAEGVETEQQFQLLRVAGVDFVQGFLFDRPCPIQNLMLDGVCTSPALQPDMSADGHAPSHHVFGTTS